MSSDDEKTQKQVEHFKAKLSGVLELQRATSAFEHAALKPVFLLNGGAVAAMLTFYGTLTAKSGGFPVGIAGNRIIWAILIWVVGLCFAAASTAAGFFSQLDFQREGTQSTLAILAKDNGDSDGAVKYSGAAACYFSRAERLRIWAISFWTLSLAAFIAGSVVCLLAFVVP